MNDNEKVSKKHLRLKFSHILIVFLLFIVGAFALFRLSLRSKLSARIEAIRAAGYPVTCAELDQWYTIPEDAENAAYTIIDAFSYYREPDRTALELLPLIGRAKLPARTEPLAEETKAVIAQYIADNNEALELLHEAAAIKHCRYPIDLSVGLPPLSDIRKASMLLNLEAVLHAENVNPQLGARSVMSIFGISHSLQREPVLISQLVRIACQALAVSSLERVINRVEFTDEQLLELAQVIAGAEDRSNMHRAFAGERCHVLSVLREPGAMDPGVIGRGIPAAPILELYRALGLADMDAITYLDLMEGYIKATELPPPRRQEAAEAVDAKLESTSKIHILLHLFKPAFSRTIMLELRVIANLRAARVALAVQRYRLALGRLPDTLADLVPTYLDAVPKDPFDGNQMRYKKLDAGFVIYSINDDLSDDGGKERLPQSKRLAEQGSNWDVTFTVER